MSSYNRRSSFGGGRYKGGDFRSRDRRREMYKAVCDECGNDCEVPFKPSGDKPIYCSDCFEKKNAGTSKRSNRRDFGRSDFGKRDDTNRQILEQVSSLNIKLDRILKVIEGSVEKAQDSKKTKVKKVVKKVDSKNEKNETKKVRKKEAKKSTEKN